ncbi:MAG: ribosome small subunit-dependent GTPase A [Candidatus Latescibacterota bacterium]
MDLEAIGWGPPWDAAFAAWRGEECVPGRVARVDGPRYRVYTAAGEVAAELPGRMLHQASGGAALPAVGDWVALRPLPDEERGMVAGILPRRTCFSRRGAGGRTRTSGGRTEEQVVAANVDTVFIVIGLDQDYSVRRLERYLTLAWDSGALPVAVLNKADLCRAVEARLAEAAAVAHGVDVHAVSAAAGEGLEPLRQHVRRGRTAVLLGSSGVGKSTLINALLQEPVQRVTEVRTSDGKGRHTTTHRELLLVPGGGALIDNPGMREVQLWADEEALQSTFDEIEALAARCRFRDCAHLSEPGCAVRRALREGALDAERLESYRRMQRELRRLAGRQDQRARLEEKARGKQLARWQREYQQREEQ